MESLLDPSLGIVPSELSLAMISFGDMDMVSMASRDGVCEREAAFDEHLDTGLALREWRKSSSGISSDLKHVEVDGWCLRFAMTYEGKLGNTLAVVFADSIHETELCYCFLTSIALSIWCLQKMLMADALCRRYK